METDIRLNESSLLRCLRTVAVGMAGLAVVISGLALTVKLLLWVTLFGVLLMYATGSKLKSRQVCRLILQEIADKTRNTSGSVYLVDGRHIEARLESGYCLWWLQILRLKSHDGWRTVIVLPDSCDANSRRQLRKLLIR